MSPALHGRHARAGASGGLMVQSEVALGFIGPIQGLSSLLNMPPSHSVTPEYFFLPECHS